MHIPHRDKADPHLGKQVHHHLKKLGIETPGVSDKPIQSQEEKIIRIETDFKSIMKTLGLDLTDDSLQDTPKRVAKMYVNELFWGLDPNLFPRSMTVENKMKYDEMVFEEGIPVQSCCEHHIVPIVGKATVAYIPKDKVLGLSKMNRVVEYFSRRPQVQERLTEQVYHALSYVLGTESVAVLISAAHFCVMCRGVQHVGSNTVTSKLGGDFKQDPATRAEFMALARTGK